jgi:formylglycine-generating enzyme required for sulfatase activity
VHVETILQERLESENFYERVAVIDYLSSLTGEKHLDLFIRALADEYPQVRVAAIRTLDRLQSDDEWRKSLTYECYVPAGKFTIGDDQGNSAAEPMNEIYLDSFYIGRYPVTNADFKRYSEDKGRSFEIPEGKADHPVIGVSWDDARDYVAWAGMRLLTEEEWEKAASWQEQGSGSTGGKKRRYPWGDEFDESKCNTFESGNDDTTPVGNYSPEGDSPYGVADMAGNVWEWTSSLYQGSPHWTDSEHEEISSFDGLRVMRGGSFYSYHTSACTSFRWRDTPQSVMEAVGIRVGFTLPQKNRNR